MENALLANKMMEETYFSVTLLPNKVSEEVKTDL